MLWLNSDIRIQGGLILWSRWINKGILCIRDIVQDNGQFKQWEDIDNMCLMWIDWLSLQKAIPIIWKSLLRDVEPAHDVPYLFEKLSGLWKVTRFVYDTLIKDELYVLKYAYTWREQSIDLDPLLYLKAFQNIYRCTNVTKLRDFQYHLLLNKLVFNKDFVSWGWMDDELCNFCGCNTETFTHVYSECSIVCKIFKDLKDVFHKNGIEISIGITDIILNRFHENPMHVANLIGLVCKQYIY